MAIVSEVDETHRVDGRVRGDLERKAEGDKRSNEGLGEHFG
jgi:hypothetical protein